MTRFFFNVPAAGIVDRDGTELESIAAVLDEAIARAQETLRARVLAGEDRQSWVLVVTDVGGASVLALRLTDTPAAV